MTVFPSTNLLINQTKPEFFAWLLNHFPECISKDSDSHHSGCDSNSRFNWSLYTHESLVISLKRHVCFGYDINLIKLAEQLILSQHSMTSHLPSLSLMADKIRVWEDERVKVTALVLKQQKRSTSATAAGEQNNLEPQPSDHWISLNWRMCQHMRRKRDLLSRWQGESEEVLHKRTPSRCNE